MHTTTAYSFIPFIIFAVCLLLQMKLSKFKSRWPGLVIPIICLLFSIFTVINISVLNPSTIETAVAEDMNEGIEITEGPIKVYYKDVDTRSMVVTVIYLLIIYNIPTFILVSVYVFNRGKIRKKRETEKMSL